MIQNMHTHSHTNPNFGYKRSLKTEFSGIKRIYTQHVWVTAHPSFFLFHTSCTFFILVFLYFISLCVSFLFFLPSLLSSLHYLIPSFILSPHMVFFQPFILPLFLSLLPSFLCPFTRCTYPSFLPSFIHSFLFSFHSYFPSLQISSGYFLPSFSLSFLRLLSHRQTETHFGLSMKTSSGKRNGDSFCLISITCNKQTNTVQYSLD